jgi:hypothetical protein
MRLHFRQVDENWSLLTSERNHPSVALGTLAISVASDKGEDIPAHKPGFLFWERRWLRDVANTAADSAASFQWSRKT